MHHQADLEQQRVREAKELADKLLAEQERLKRQQAEEDAARKQAENEERLKMEEAKRQVCELNIFNHQLS